MLYAVVTPLTVLLYASAAALASIPGGLVRWSADIRQNRWIGWAHALAAGGMLGAAFVLTAVPGVAHLAAAAGGALGVGFIVLTHSLTGMETLDLSRPDRADPTAAPRLVVTHALHGCTEGVAIGVAMAVDLPLGVFMALAIAVHNIPEAALLGGATQGDNEGGARPLGLSILSNLGQPVFAVGAWITISAAPEFLPWALGFAVGALLNLVMTELLPASYREAGSTSIAVMASVSLALVVLLGRALP